MKVLAPAAVTHLYSLEWRETRRETFRTRRYFWIWIHSLGEGSGSWWRSALRLLLLGLGMHTSPRFYGLCEHQCNCLSSYRTSVECWQSAETANNIPVASHTWMPQTGSSRPGLHLKSCCWRHQKLVQNLGVDVYRLQISTGSSETLFSFPAPLWTSLHPNKLAPEVNARQKRPSREEDLDLTGVLLGRMKEAEQAKETSSF